MFVEHLLRSTTEPEGARILDLCAAPGGKATLYSTLAGGDGIVIANEVIRSRALILADNIRKWGIGNTMVTNNDPAHFAGLGEWFDESLNVCEEADVFYRIAKTWELERGERPAVCGPSAPNRIRRMGGTPSRRSPDLQYLYLQPDGR